MKSGALGGAPPVLDAADLERHFEDCFQDPFRTVLVGGGSEPLYRPSKDPERRPHQVIYRENFFASALHEVAHWCLAGAKRRRLEDYGYWYSPDGRSAEEQVAFELAEVDPQALEWIFSDACSFRFHLSIDNLSGASTPIDRFQNAVGDRKRRFLSRRLPTRAEDFRQALRRASSPRLEMASDLDRIPEDDLRCWSDRPV